jgi:hypothetical protein
VTRVAFLPGAGSALALEEPDEVAKQIAAFLGLQVAV